MDGMDSKPKQLETWKSNFSSANCRIIPVEREYIIIRLGM